MQLAEAAKRSVRRDSLLPTGEQSDIKDVTKGVDEKLLRRSIEETVGNAVVPGGGVLAGMFSGKLAGTARTDLIAKAQEMLNQFIQDNIKKTGLSRERITTPQMEEIKRNTGYFLFPWKEKKWWKVEDDLLDNFDLHSQLKRQFASSSPNTHLGEFELQELLAPKAFDKLTEIYPQLAKHTAKLEKTQYGKGGAHYDEKNQQLSLASDTAEDLLKQVIHELTHGVQRVEKSAARGTNAVGLYMHPTKLVSDEFHSLLTKPNSNSRWSLNELLEQAAYNVYLSNAGEVMARLDEHLLDRARTLPARYAPKNMSYNDLLQAIEGNKLQVELQMRRPQALQKLWLNTPQNLAPNIKKP